MPTHAPARAIRRWQAALIIALFFVAVAGSAAIGWWYARESPAHQGPIVLISMGGLPATELRVLWRRANGYAGDRRVRLGVRGLRARVHPLPADAAVPRIAAHRPAPVRAWRPRRSRIHARRERADARGAAPQPRLHDRRGGLLVPAAPAVRHRAGILVLRRRDSGDDTATRRPRSSARAADAGCRRALDPDAERPALLPLRAGRRTRRGRRGAAARPRR